MSAKYLLPGCEGCDCGECPHYRAEETAHVESVTVNIAGSGYSSAPAISFTGGKAADETATPTQATAHAVMSGSAPDMVIDSIVVDTPGSYYTEQPTVVIDPALGSATATAVMAGTERFKNITRVPNRSCTSGGLTCPPSVTNPDVPFTCGSPNYEDPATITTDSGVAYHAGTNPPAYWKNVDSEQTGRTPPLDKIAVVDLPPNGDIGWNTGGTTVQENVFESYVPPRYVNSVKCKKRGWKGVQARKVFHGRYGFLAPGDLDEAGKESHFAQKYLTVTRRIKLEAFDWEFDPSSYCDDTPNSINFTLELVSTIDRLSGVRHTTVTTTDTGETSASINYLDTFLFEHQTELMGVGGTRYDIYAMALGDIDDAYVTAHNPDDSFCQDCGEGAVLELQEDCERTDTYFKWSKYINDCMYCDDGLDPPIVTWCAEKLWFRVTVEVTLSDEYYSKKTLGEYSLQEDAEDLLEEWDLGDDIQYPWREDSHCGVLPLVVRDEETEPQSPDVVAVGGLLPINCADATESAWDLDGCTSFWDIGADNEKIKTGAVIGAPAPNGYVKYFAFRQPTYISGSEMSPTGIGQWNTDEILTLPHATYWIPKNQQALFRLMRGGWYAYNYTFNASLLLTDTLVVQSWAEVIGWESPSHNWFRPCGADRLTYGYDQSPGRDCFAYVDGVLTPRPYGGLRWGCPGICGRIEVSTATQAGGSGTDVTVHLAESAWLKNGDLVDFSSVGALGTGVTVKGLSSTVAAVTTFQVALAGDLGVYAGGGYVWSNGASGDPSSWSATKESWRTKAPLGDYTLTVQETGLGAASCTQDEGNTQDTTCPNAVFITPNDVTYYCATADQWHVLATAGDFFIWPISALATGDVVKLDVNQLMIDPLFRAPWDGNWFGPPTEYATCPDAPIVMPTLSDMPLEEARKEPPAGAPALPADYDQLVTNCYSLKNESGDCWSPWEWVL